MADYEKNNDVMDWNDSVEEDGSSFVTLAPGRYHFVIERVERTWFNGSAKMPACPQAIVSLGIDSDKGHAVVKDNIYLLKSREWKISSLLRAVGLKQHGQKAERGFWDKLKGREGECEIVNNKGTKGDTVFNNVSKYIDAAPAPVSTPRPF